MLLTSEPPYLIPVTFLVFKKKIGLIDTSQFFFFNIRYRKLISGFSFAGVFPKAT